MLQIAADRLADMPATLAAFQTGTLSWGAVRGIVTATRSLTAAQRRWLDATVAGDHVRLGRVDGDTVVADAEQAADRARPELQRARADRAAAGQRLVLQPGMDGGGAAFACLDAETFTAVQTAIASLTHDVAAVGSRPTSRRCARWPANGSPAAVPTTRAPPVTTPMPVTSPTLAGPWMPVGHRRPRARR